MYHANYWHSNYWHSNYWYSNTGVVQSATTALTLAGLQASIAADTSVTQSATTALTLAELQASVAVGIDVTQSATTALTLTENQGTVDQNTTVSQVSTPTMTLGGETPTFSQVLYGGDWFHKQYWAGDYWASGYWAVNLYLVANDARWWHENYWHVNHWADGYWAQTPAIIKGDQEVSQTSTPLMTMTAQFATVIPLTEVFTATPTMTMTAQATDTANDVTVEVSIPIMTLTGINTSADVGDNYVGNINFTNLMSATFGFTDTIMVSAPTMTMTGQPSNVSEGGHLAIGTTSTPSMTLSGLDILVTNPIIIAPQTPTMTMTSNNTDAGYGTVISATAPSMTMSGVITNISANDININVIDISLGSMMMSELNPEVTGESPSISLYDGGGDSDSPTIKTTKRTVTPEEYQARRLKREDEEVFLLVSLFTDTVINDSTQEQIL